MGKKEKLKKKIVNYFFDHPIQNRISVYLLATIISAVSGLIFAFGFATFTTAHTADSLKLVTGGFSGFTQSIVLIITHFNPGLPSSMMISILYFVFNVPALIFAFFKIGKKFAYASAVNVGLSSLFITLFSNLEFVQQIGSSPFIVSSPLTRVLFAGICTGASSGIALKFGCSCGGMDIVTCYFGLRKSTGVGKYSVIANTLVIIFFTICNLIVKPEQYVEAILIVPFALVYFLISSIVIDYIHIRNKKIEVEIITANETMTDILVSIFPHSCTILRGEGAYSHQKKQVIKMIVTSYETRKVVRTVKKIDPDAFVTLTPLQQVYGNFFINPVE